MSGITPTPSAVPVNAVQQYVNAHKEGAPSGHLVKNSQGLVEFKADADLHWYSRGYKKLSPSETLQVIQQAVSSAELSDTEKVNIKEFYNKVSAELLPQIESLAKYDADNGHLVINTKTDKIEYKRDADVSWTERVFGSYKRLHTNDALAITKFILENPGLADKDKNAVREFRAQILDHAITKYEGMKGSLKGRIHDAKERMLAYLHEHRELELAGIKRDVCISIETAVEAWKRGDKSDARALYTQASWLMHSLLSPPGVGPDGENIGGLGKMAGRPFVQADNVIELVKIRDDLLKHEKRPEVKSQDPLQEIYTLDDAIADRFVYFDEDTASGKDPVTVWTRPGETVADFEETVAVRRSFSKHVGAARFRDPFPDGVVESVLAKLKQAEEADKKP